MKRLVLFAFAAALCACGSSNNNNGGGGGNPDSGTPSGPTITVSNLTYSPSELTVDAGTTITLINADATDHSVTSESADNALTPGAVNGVSFDVAIPPATGQTGGPYGGSGGTNGTATLNIPANAPSGTVIPFYCRFHTTDMNPVNGHITIR